MYGIDQYAATVRNCPSPRRLAGWTEWFWPRPLWRWPHGSCPLAAGTGTIVIYVLVTLAAPSAGTAYVLVLSAAGVAWSAAFGLFALLTCGHCGCRGCHAASECGQSSARAGYAPMHVPSCLNVT